MPPSQPQSSKPKSGFRSAAQTLAVIFCLAALLLLYKPHYAFIIDYRQPSLTRSLYGDGIDPHVPVDSEANSSTQLLFSRDDYTCGPGKPCSNGACCGASGYCGYGPTYCGKGCTSNCNAKAECGQYADPPNKKCPLNTCCSEFGFCGTTKDFCTGKCQSNCVMDPKPPKGGSGKVLDKVIGYYESWSDRLACHRTAPGDLPLDALTHVNYAFAYIDPSTFQIVTMDTETPASLFQSVANLKQYKSSLKVFISVGGWTFSDNGTSTQPVFGNIAATAANRQRFATNVVKFLNQYGFDGIDIDWEYPGAPDRGGQTRDTVNYVSLVQTLRQTFDSASGGRALGITFTAPSSYWYLRWFDLPGLLKYSDWANVMTYDLHGVWDRDNPIGNIVQAHTNLTEIKLALQLFWRVNVPTSKIAMGFGFYGRSFQLASASCSTPGCAFKGGAAAGPCSATSGILTYYEIMALLKQNPGLKPVHDSTAAVKYVTFNKDQWVSYDDADTFKEKKDWADSVGISGSLIWASDYDDDKYSAHTGLVGKTGLSGISSLSHINTEIKSFSATSDSVAQNMAGQNGQDCKIQDSCQNTDQGTCPYGQTRVGWERGKCGKNKGHSICCPSASAPSSCIWRGSGGDCNGQCHVGEATLFRSSWGGWPTESNQRKCSRGVKVFCCNAGGWRDLTSSCYWSKCGKSCKSDEEKVSSTVKGCRPIDGKKSYCCARPAPFTECRWVGSYPDCPNAKCASDEVTIELSKSGDSWALLCSWGRQLADCCMVSSKVTEPLTCSSTLCDIDPGLCSIADDSAFGSGRGHDELKRGLIEGNQDINNTHVDALGNSTSVQYPWVLEKRGGKRPFKYYLDGLTGLYTTFSRPYPSRGTLFATAAGLRDVIHRWWRMRTGTQQRCDDTAVDSESINTSNPPRDGETEHPVDLQVIVPFIETANRGRLPSGGPTRTPRIPSTFWANVWNSPTGLPANLQRVSPTSPELRTPSDRVMEAFGSNTNRYNLVLTERQINAAKGSIFGLEAPISNNNFRNLVLAGSGIDGQAEEDALQEIRAVVAIFRYLNDADIRTRFRAVASAIRSQLAIIELNTQGSTGLSALWDEFWPDYRRQIEIFAQEWVQERIDVMRDAYNRIGPTPQNKTRVLATLLSLENQIPNMRLP